MFNSLYPRVRALAEGPHAERALAAIAFAESSFFPIPPDVLLAPMALANPKRAWRYALIATVASVIGAGRACLASRRGAIASNAAARAEMA